MSKIIKTPENWLSDVPTYVPVYDIDTKHTFGGEAC